MNGKSQGSNFDSSKHVDPKSRRNQSGSLKSPTRRKKLNPQNSTVNNQNQKLVNCEIPVKITNKHDNKQIFSNFDSDIYFEHEKTEHQQIIEHEYDENITEEELMDFEIFPTSMNLTFENIKQTLKNLHNKDYSFEQLNNIYIQVYQFLMDWKNEKIFCEQLDDELFHQIQFSQSQNCTLSKLKETKGLDFLIPKFKYELDELLKLIHFKIHSKENFCEEKLPMKKRKENPNEIDNLSKKKK
eukprot:gene9261-1348_t